MTIGSGASDGNPTAGRRRNHALWIGPLVTAVGAVSYFLVFARWPALRDVPWVNLPLTILGVAISLLAVWRAFFRAAVWRGKILGSIGFVFSLFMAALFGAYVFLFSSMLPQASPLTLELRAAPEISLADQNERIVSLADLRGRKVVVTFYRGFW